MEQQYQIPNKYTVKQTEKLSLVVTNYANAFVKPLIYKNVFGDATEYLGRQIITDVKLTLPTYEEERFNLNTNRYERTTVQGAEVTLDTVLVEISSTKNIVQTSINGMKGTVKEYISNGDYTINFSGAIVSKGKGFPFEDVQLLNTILKAPVAVEVESELLALFSVYNIVVSDASFPSKEGYSNTQLFSFNALSDEPLELKL